MQKELKQLAKSLGLALSKHGLKLATAESCTAGEVAYVVTTISGSAHWFERGFVTYSNEAKIEMLGVRATSLKRHGAVSGQIAKQMALGALKHSHADVSLAITGIAGPNGGTIDKPVGTVHFGWAARGKGAETVVKHFAGSRNQIRDQATIYALQHLLRIINKRR